MKTTMTRREFLSSTVAGGAAFAAFGVSRLAARGQKRPNILVITTDQQHRGMISCTGNRYLKTPALDGLARSGVRFERAYVTNPVCVPSRFSLQTGRYPTAIGIRHNADKLSLEMVSRYQKQALGSIFRDNGYRTVYGGKVHLPGSMEDAKTYGYQQVLSVDERRELAESCADFLQQEGRDSDDKNRKPFLLFASFINPHDIGLMAINDFSISQGLGPYESTESRVRDALSTCESFLAKVPVDGRKEFIRENCPPIPDNF